MRYSSCPSTSVVLAGLSVASALAACTSSVSPASGEATSSVAAPATQPVLLDVNDVTVLFPYDGQTQRLSPDLPLDGFVSPAEFASVVAAARTTQIFRDGGTAPPGSQDIAAYENWRIVGFRFDPCAPSTSFVSGIPPEFAFLPGCLAAIRLVAQPVTARGFAGAPSSDSPLGVPAPQDFAMHLIYNLDVIAPSADTPALQDHFHHSATGAAPQLIAGLQQIKAVSAAAGAGTNGALLGVHPGLAAELGGDATYVAGAVTSFLTTFLDPTKLANVAVLGIPLDSPVPWQFLVGAIPSVDGVPQPFVQGTIAGFASPTSVQSFTSTRNGLQAFPEKPDGAINVPSLFDHLSDPDGRASAVRGAFAIEIPAARHVLNGDCVSCHAAQLFQGPPAGSFLPFRSGGDRTLIHLTATDLPAVRYVPPAGVTGYLASEAFDTSGWHIHNLGYFGLHPRIAERTLNETAEVVDLVNRLLAGDERSNPGLDCGTDRGALDALYLCQIAAPSESARQACFAGCTIRGAGAP